MVKKLNSLFFVLVLMMVNAFSFAQEVEKINSVSPKFNVSEKISYFNFTNEDIVEYDTNIAFKLADKLNVDLSLPVYDDENNPSNGFERTWQLNNGVYGKGGVGVGDLDANLTYDAATVYDINIKLTAGVGIPFGTEFDSNSPVIHGGFIFGYGKDKWNLSQSVEYFVVDDYAYDPFFGGFVDCNYFELNTKISYSWNNAFSLCGNVEQFYSDDQQMVLIGPSFEYHLSDNVDLNAGVLFSAVDELNYDSLNSVISAGFSIKF